MRPARSAALPVVLAAVAGALSACGSLPPVHGPSTLARSRCAPPNDSVPPNGEFVVCMNVPR